MATDYKIYVYFTDIPITIRHLLNNEFMISWTNLFKSVSTIEAYEVSIGSLEDSTDIMMPTCTARDEVTVYIQTILRNSTLL